MIRMTAPNVWASVACWVALALCAACELTGIGQPTCAADSACDDGVFCNGVETCDPGAPGASAFGCVQGDSCAEQGGRCDEANDSCDLLGSCGVICSDGVFCNGLERCDDATATCIAGAPPCPELACNEANDTCGEPCRDLDGDGHADIACGGTDCDDADEDVSPGRTEVCDAAGVDEDCDPTTIGERDADGDGYIDRACFNGDVAGTDCDDFDAAVNEGSPEVCNGIDDDCDDQVDEGVSFLLFSDNDDDGYGAAGSAPTQTCFGPGLSDNAGDCDDDNPYIMPGGIECVPGGQGYELRVCQEDGSWLAGECPNFQRCIEQPTGLDICIP